MLVEPERKTVITSRDFWLVLIGFILLSYAFPAFFLAISPRDGGSINFGYAWPGLVAGSVLQFIALIWGIRTRSANRPFAMGLLMGVLLTVVVLPICAVVGLLIYFAPLGI